MSLVIIKENKVVPICSIKKTLMKIYKVKKNHSKIQINYKILMKIQSFLKLKILIKHYIMKIYKAKKILKI